MTSAPSRILKIATRRSLLALAQSTWVARQLEERHPGLRVELVGIETRGDRILDVPLQSVAGKEFFVAELDAALRDGRAHASVHSLKDLSTERPSDLVLAAVPERELPNDAALFRPDVPAKIARGETLRVGTSSPRRIENLRAFLSKALPGGEAKVELVELRGNVNTRISRLHENPAASKRALDGVVLALAGLNRLAADAAPPRGTGASAELRRLTQGLLWMVLPIPENPTAPGQGALAVECRADDRETRALLATLDDAGTRRRVSRERELFAQWGGGCHQKFGITVLEPRDDTEVLYARGLRPDGTRADRCEWPLPEWPGSASLGGEPASWDGIAERQASVESPSGGEPRTSQSQKAALQTAMEALSRPDHLVWVTHVRALSARPEALVGQQRSRIWVPGMKTWFELARRGWWIEGSSEGFGYEWFRTRFLPAPALGLSELTEVTLTHAGAEVPRPETPGRRLETYSIHRDGDDGPDSGYSPESLARLKTAEIIYWGAFSQYLQLHRHAHPKALHCTGPGFTAREMERRGAHRPYVFPDRETWKAWVAGLRKKDGT